MCYKHLKETICKERRIMEQENRPGEELFDALNKKKQKKKRKLLRTVLTVVAVILVILVASVAMLRREVENRFADAAAEVLSYEVTSGTIHTLVSGSGTLTEEDLETISVPDGVTVNEVLVEAGDSVRQGEVLATVDLATVMSAMAELQTRLEELDEQIAEAKDDEVDDEILAGVQGRVKILYAQEGMDVGTCMAEHGALAVLSLDDHMALDIPVGDLKKDTPIRALRADGTDIPAIVGSISRDTATILVYDNGPEFGETVTVLSEDGIELGSGELYVYMPLAITGYAGTIRSVHIRENQVVQADTTAFRLKNTSFSANYDALLRQRQELEEALVELLTIYRDGALLSPMDATVSSVSFGQEEAPAANATDMSGLAAMYGAAAMQQPAATGDGGILTLYPGARMRVTIGIGETDILALQPGQEAEIVVSSISGDPIPGLVTQISREANSSMGVTQYSAEVILDTVRGMLPGMTAEVDIKIEGNENALIIPVDALHQTSAMSYVYTTYDEETMQYGGMVEVTTGMQNDSFVEITSGLSEGDIVRYTEAQFDFFAFITQLGQMGGQNAGMNGFRGMGG